MGFSAEMPEMATLIDKLGGFFDKDRIEKEAREAKFIQRPRKLTGIAFLGVCVMQGFGQSLGMLCGMLGEFSITMCEQSLHERFTDHALAFMKRLFSQMLEMEMSGGGPMDFLGKFSGVFPSAGARLYPPCWREAIKNQPKNPNHTRGCWREVPPRVAIGRVPPDIH